MSIKITQKAVKNNYSTVICVGYCALQSLLSYEQPIAHTERKEGWGADVYHFGATAIVTGYAPFGNVKADYEVCKAYESKAQAIQYDYSLSYDERKMGLQELISEFVGEVTQ